MSYNKVPFNKIVERKKMKNKKFSYFIMNK